MDNKTGLRAPTGGTTEPGPRVQPLFLLYLIFFLQFGLFVWTTLRPFTIQPPDTQYMMLRGHLVYTSLIRQARDGAWAVQIPHTTRESPHVYAHLFFVALGKLSALTQIDPPTIYMVSRVVAALVLFGASYWVITLLVPRSLRWLAIIFTLGIEPGPLLGAITKFPVLGWIPAIFSYYPQVVAYRHFGLPHHTLGEALGLVTFGVIWISLKDLVLAGDRGRGTPKKGPLVGIFGGKPLTGPALKLILLALLSLITTTVLPPYMLVLSLTVLMPWFLITLALKGRTFMPFLAIWIPMLLVGLFLRHEFAKGIPWKDFNQVEKTWVTPAAALENYISSLLLYLPWMGLLTAATIKYVTQNGNTIYRLVSGVARGVRLPSTARSHSDKFKDNILGSGDMVALARTSDGRGAGQDPREAVQILFLMFCWIIGPVLLLPFTRYAWFPLASFRLMDGYNYFPAGILATYGFACIPLLFSKKITRWLQISLLAITVGLSCSLSFLYTKQTFVDQQRFWTNVYLLHDEWKAIGYLDTVPKHAGIMVLEYVGEIIPEYATVRVFLGSTPAYSDWAERRGIATRFYNGTMSPQEAAATLTREHIDYVYWGQDEKKLTQTKSFYPDLLTPVFQNSTVTIFEVK